MGETDDQSHAVPPRAVLWDVDGTLIDSAELHYQAWRDTLACEQFELTRARFRTSFGLRNDAVLRGYFGPDLPLTEIERIDVAKEARFRELLLESGIPPLPGVQFWLERLCETGWRQAVASSAPRLSLEAMLRALRIRSFFGAVLAAEDVERGKPDPQVFQRAAAALRVQADRCVVVEDAPAGIQGAHRAGMRTVGVRSTHADITGDRVVTTLDQLPDDAFEVLIPRLAAE